MTSDYEREASLRDLADRLEAQLEAERARHAALVAAARFMLKSAPDNPRAFECKVITSRLLALRAALDGEPHTDPECMSIPDCGPHNCTCRCHR